MAEQAALRPGSTVFVESNSFMAEVICYWTCYDKDVVVWRLSFNSMIAYHVHSRAVLLLLDNDYYLNERPRLVVKNL